MKGKRTYLDSVHTYGRLWCLAALVVILAVPALMSWHLNAWPDVGIVGKASAPLRFCFTPPP